MLGCAVIGLGPVGFGFSITPQVFVVLPPVLPIVVLQILQITCNCRASYWEIPNHYQATEPILYLSCPDQPDKKKNKLPFAFASENQSPVSFPVFMPSTCPLK